MVNKELYKILESSKVFDQTNFIDNFYDRINIKQIQEKELQEFLEFAYKKGANPYIKRSILIILCDLTLTGTLTNKHIPLSLLSDVLKNDNDVFLLTISIKYYTLLAQNFTSTDTQKLVDLSDHDNADVASEALYWLGYIELTSSKGSIDNLVVSLNKAKTYFKESINSIENRIDAIYYCHVIDYLEAFVSTEGKMVDEHFGNMEKVMFERKMYEWDHNFLEFDLLIFQILQKLKESFSVLMRSISWINIEHEVNTLLLIQREIEKTKLSSGKHATCIKAIYNSTIEVASNLLLEIQLNNERARIENLRNQSIDVDLNTFLDRLIALIPFEKNNDSENPELLLGLRKFCSNEEALEKYQQISNKHLASEIVEAFASLKSNNSECVSEFITGSINGQAIYHDLKQKINGELPNYNQDKLRVFLRVLEEVIRYTYRTTINSSKKEFLFLYNKSEGGKGSDALEEDLQDSMYDKLVSTRIAYGFEHERPKFTDGGRVDIVFKTDLVTFPIELKKTDEIVTLDRIKEDYISQAQTYSSGYDQLGIFVLLDLTDKGTKPSPNVKDWFHFHHLESTTSLPINHPDYIISVVIPGNKLLPSSKSKY